MSVNLSSASEYLPYEKDTKYDMFDCILSEGPVRRVQYVIRPPDAVLYVWNETLDPISLRALTCHAT